MGWSWNCLRSFGVLEGGVVAVHGRADGAPAYAVARLVEAHERALQALCAGEQVGGGDVHVLKREAAGEGGAEAPLAVHFGGGEAGAVGLNQEAADPVAPAAFVLRLLAQMMAMSAMVPEVIHIFSPLRMYSSPDLRARVVMPPGLEPKPGSVRPKQPSFLPLARAGSQVFFCSSEPKV